MNNLDFYQQNYLLNDLNNTADEIWPQGNMQTLLHLHLD